jgi:hypothetical protein
MSAVRTRLCSLGRMTGKNVSVMERICVQCHEKQYFLNTGSSVSTHTQYYYSYSHAFLFLKHHYMSYFNYMTETAM